jgi:hypothetical protein
MYASKMKDLRDAYGTAVQNAILKEFGLLPDSKKKML